MRTNKSLCWVKNRRSKRWAQSRTTKEVFNFFAPFFSLSHTSSLSHTRSPSLALLFLVYTFFFWTINSLLPFKGNFYHPAPREHDENNQTNNRTNRKMGTKWVAQNKLHAWKMVLIMSHTYKLYRMWEINSKSLLHSTPELRKKKEERKKKKSCGLQLQRCINLDTYKRLCLRQESRNGPREKMKKEKRHTNDGKTLPKRRALHKRIEIKSFSSIFDSAFVRPLTHFANKHTHTVAYCSQSTGVGCYVLGNVSHVIVYTLL